MSVQGEYRLSSTLGPRAVTFMPIGFLVGNGVGLPVMRLRRSPARWASP
ncbi:MULTISPECIES: hypothetical protein [unclassified Saccharopolyspora]|nr:hypothetical protein [Saccharopolyspora sp. HNM0986]MBK0870106.1 hypothetical protein [Saccharopolyspora sp. HNM0986]